MSGGLSWRGENRRSFPVQAAEGRGVPNGSFAERSRLGKSFLHSWCQLLSGAELLLSQMISTEAPNLSFHVWHSIIILVVGANLSSLSRDRELSLESLNHVKVQSYLAAWASQGGEAISLFFGGSPNCSNIFWELLITLCVAYVCYYMME